MNLQSDLPVLARDSYLSWAEVDLEAIRYNYRVFRGHVGAEAEIFAVIKADAYGHGAVETARALLKEKVSQFCVARVEEAAQLREAGIETPILVLAPPFVAQALVAARYGCSIVVCDRVHVEAVAAAQYESGVRVPVHIKVDVGMGRLGISPPNAPQLVDLCRELRVPIEGVMAHLPCADAVTFEVTEPMVDAFLGVRQALMGRIAKQGVRFHVCNSAAAMRCPRGWLDAVRIGIGLYGQFPSVEMEREFDLRPAMSLKSRVTYLKDVAEGTAISYGHLYRTLSPARLATVPLGYADGWPRHATGRADFIVNGRLAPQVGRVCMDQVVLDVTGIPDVELGYEVMAFGRQKDMMLRVEDVAARFDSIGYELTTRLGRRVPRFYV